MERRTRPSANHLIEQAAEAETLRKHHEAVMAAHATVDSGPPTAIVAGMPPIAGGPRVSSRPKSAARSRQQRRRPATAGAARRNPKREMQMAERYAEIERQNLLLLTKMHDILRGPAAVDNRRKTKARSLNVEKRRRRLEKITEENHVRLRL